MYSTPAIFRAHAARRVARHFLRAREPSRRSAADQITFVSQGGAYQKAQTVAILDPAAKKLGITINQDSTPDAWPVIKTQVASGKPTWDVVDTPTGYCLRGGEQGLIEKLDFSKMPNAAAMPAEYRSDYSVAYEFYSSVLAYSQKKYRGRHCAEQLGRFLGREEIPRPSRAPQPSDRNARSGADGGRRCARQTLSARCRPGLQEARRDQALTSPCGGPRARNRRNC